MKIPANRCLECETTCSSLTFKTGHNCQNNLEPRNTINFATQYAVTYIDRYLYIVDGNAVKMDSYSADGDIVFESIDQGWARGASHGDQYGATYMTCYESNIVEMFKRGPMSNAAKMGQGQMKKKLINKFCLCIDIPFKVEIRAAITKFLVQKKKRPIVVIARIEEQKFCHSKSSSKTNEGPTSQRFKYHTEGIVSALGNVMQSYKTFAGLLNILKIK